jgi:flagellar motility protein MotE (MotC chaperone)
MSGRLTGSERNSKVMNRNTRSTTRTALLSLLAAAAASASMWAHAEDATARPPTRDEVKAERDRAQASGAIDAAFDENGQHSKEELGVKGKSTKTREQARQALTEARKSGAKRDAFHESAAHAKTQSAGAQTSGSKTGLARPARPRSRRPPART